MIAPRELLDTSLGQIRTLSAFLREQLGADGDGPESQTAEIRACNEILAYLTALTLRLEAAGPDISGGTRLAARTAAAWRSMRAWPLRSA